MKKENMGLKESKLKYLKLKLLKIILISLEKLKILMDFHYVV